ncbi:MAG: hypothetical protein OXD33_08175 [Rhodobacteraceae bacterium]|nr:hypothetical protein [Paracoccaceae bacterium]
MEAEYALEESELSQQTYPARFAGQRIADITSQDVRDWFASLHATPVSADRSMPVLSVIMTVAEVEGLRPEGSNPCKGIKRYRRQNRDRFLSDVEFGRLSHAPCEAAPSAVVSRIRLLALGAYKDELTYRIMLRQSFNKNASCCILSNGLYKPLALTGCQSSEIRTLHWVDYRDGHLFLRDGKTGPRTVWMSGAARAVLDTLPRTSPWVFPGRKGPVSETMLAHTWANIRREVNLKDVRLHDIRHSYANVATTSGEDVNSRARTQK